jgi:PAS domain S-box-containing protein
MFWSIVMLRRLWNKISRIGLVDDMAPSRARQASLVNQLNTLAFVMYLLAQVINLFYGYYLFAVMLLSLALGLLPVYRLNQKGRYVWAKVLFFADAYLGIVASTILLGKDAPIHFYLIPCILGIIVVFDKRETRAAFGLAFVFAITLIGLELDILPRSNFLSLSHAQAVSARYTTFILAVVLILAVLYILHRALVEYEERIEAQQAFHETVMDSIPVSIAVLDDSGRIMFVNKRMLPDPKLRKSVLGKTELEFRQKWDRAIDRGKLRWEKLQQAFAQGTPVEFEEVAEEQNRVYWSIFTPVYNPAPQANLVISTRLDVSELRRQELVNRQKDELFRAVFENTVDALFIVDPLTAIILDCNPAAVSLFGGENKAQLIGIRADSLQLEPFDEGQMADIRSQMLENKHWHGEVAYKALGGQVFTASVAVAYGFSGEDRVTIVRLSDLSREQQIREMLHSAKERAEDASRAKSEFLSRMSHEIRTPLNAIVGLTNLMIQDNETISVENIRTIKYSSDGLLSIINDILDFSKLEADKVKLEAIPFSLRDVLERVVRTNSVAAQEKEVAINQVCGDQVPDHLVGDPLRLQQILLNLVSNSVKFTEKGEIILSIEANQMTDSEVELKIMVADTGIGIPDQAKNTIFESFTQASAGTSRRFGGTGLGLSIVRQLVTLMQGQVTVQDREGGGSVFTCLITFGFIDQKQINTPLENIPTNDFDLTGVRVLLAEDNKVNQFVAKQILGKWKVTVEVANHGEEAIAMLRANDYHIILMDIQMPIMDGIQAAQAIRQGDLPEAKRTIPIVALTADIMPDTRASVLAAGMDDIIVKPFELDELYNLLKKFI